MAMKLTKLVIAPLSEWKPVGSDNPMRATVRIDSETSKIETVLSDETARKMLDLVADEIAANAARNIRDFVDAVSTLDAEKSTALLT